MARRILTVFLFTFLTARIIVFLIVTRRIPDIYAHLGSTHIHHLNYDIFLLSGVGAYLLFARPSEGILLRVAILYGIGLALTFDEFGLWLHLGGSYWQVASFDAVVVIAGLLGLVIVAPKLSRFRSSHWVATVALSLAVTIFGITFFESFRYADRLPYRIQVIERSQPPLR